MLGRRGGAARHGWSGGAVTEYASTPGGYPVTPRTRTHHAHGDLVPRPTPRHRRKAGSGPPAAALIAWIGTHPRRGNNAATAAEGAGEPDLRPPASAGSARKVAASVALVCGAVIAVTASTTEGILGPRDTTTTPVSPQAGPGRAPDQTAPGLAAHPVPAMQVEKNMAFSPAPAAAQPRVARQAPKSIPVPPATEQVAEAAAAPPAAAPRATAPRTTAPRVRTQPDASAQRRTTSRSDTPRTSPSRQRSTSDRGSRSGGLGPTVDRTTDSLGSTLGVR